jgi:hypothetical protein
MDHLALGLGLLILLASSVLKDTVTLLFAKLSEVEALFVLKKAVKLLCSATIVAAAILARMVFGTWILLNFL